MVSHFYYANSDKIGTTILIRAMKKYGLNNFSLAILEFCKKNVIECVNLEQKWIDHYKPSYNIVKIAESSFGFTHSIDSVNKLKETLIKENHPKFGYTTSDETKNAISEGIKEFYLKKDNAFKGKLSPQHGIGRALIFCYSANNEKLIFPSINAARQHFKVRWTLIKKNLDTNKYISINDENWILQSLPRNKTQN